MMHNAKKVMWGLVAMFLLLPQALSAQFGGGGDMSPPGGGGGGDISPPGNTPRIENPLSGINSIPDLIREVLTIIRDIGFIVAVAMFVVTGFMFVTARGNEEKLSRAKRMFLYTSIGTAILLGAWIIAAAIDATISNLR